jgi:lipopolysaccharide biosynthesis glycosyltransferase
MKKNLPIVLSIILIFIIIAPYIYIKHQKDFIYFRIKASQLLLKEYKQAPENNTVNIVAITDSNYIIPLNVTIYSAIKNKNQNSIYHFYIIGVDLNKYDIKSMTEQATNNVKITVIPNKNIYSFYNPNNVINPHVPSCDILKFNLPELFPKFDKILYLDGDILVQQDLSALYNSNIEDSYVGCVQEKYIGFPLEKELGIPKFFNNGVMLLNLKKMREDNITEKLLKYKIYDAPMRFATQDAFNVVLQPALKFLDEKYNIIILDIDVNKFSDVNKYLKDGVIIHYSGNDKPWDNPNVLYSSEWQKYYDEMINEYD